MNRIYESVAALNRSGSGLLLVMGDLIDAEGEEQAVRQLREVSALCSSFRGKVRYMPGSDMRWSSTAATPSIEAERGRAYNSNDPHRHRRSARR